jgi:hypothetical protein
MATIKLQNGKVITKDGKVSCECCETICNESFLIPDRNVFQITKQEHDQYEKGGTWNCDINFQQRESVSTPQCSAIGGASRTFSTYQKGCSHAFEFFANGLVTYSGPCFGNRTDVFFLRTGIRIQLRYYNNKYYIKIVCVTSSSSFSVLGSTLVSSIEDLRNDTGYPQNNYSIDGNNLIVVKRWLPYWAPGSPTGGYPEGGYTNTSSLILSATFTPSPTI